MRACRDRRRRNVAAEERVADLLEGFGVVVDGQVVRQRDLKSLCLAEGAHFSLLAVLDHAT